MRSMAMVIVIVLICLNLSTAQSETTPNERESLQGLPGVEVVIEDVTPEAQADGLSEEAIRTAAERILRSSGIRVLTHSESIATPSSPYLYVGISTLKVKTTYAVNVRISLIQRVSLVNKPEHLIGAVTYEISAIGMYSSHLLMNLMSDFVEPDVKAFATDYLAANPR